VNRRHHLTGRRWERAESALEARKQDRETDRVERIADPLCTCGWITDLAACPMCGGARIGGAP
jgi:hypothetical protein